jgi:hypothetical protein
VPHQARAVPWKLRQCCPCADLHTMSKCRRLRNPPNQRPRCPTDTDDWFIASLAKTLALLAGCETPEGCDELHPRSATGQTDTHGSCRCERRPFEIFLCGTVYNFPKSVLLPAGPLVSRLSSPMIGEPFATLGNLTKNLFFTGVHGEKLLPRRTPKKILSWSRSCTAGL